MILNATLLLAGSHLFLVSCSFCLVVVVDPFHLGILNSIQGNHWADIGAYFAQQIEKRDSRSCTI